MVDFVQFVADRSADFGVEQEKLDREFQLVDYALSGAMIRTEQFEISDTVVEPVTVDVVHGFFGAKLTSDVLFHSMSVFQNMLDWFSCASRNSKQNIMASFAFSDSRKAMLFTVQLAYPFIFALFAAYFLFDVNTPAVIAMASVLFAAVYTDEFISRLGIFAATCVRAGHRTVQRFAIEFLSVGGKIRLHHRKRLLAFFACKVDGSSTRGRKFFRESMFTAAFQVAVFAAFFSFAWVAVKRLGTVFTDHLDRHCIVPLFANKGCVAVSIGMVK